MGSGSGSQSGSSMSGSSSEWSNKKINVQSVRYLSSSCSGQ
jgi:hypothetical protein